ncbi:carboxymuconolactone decarboxylase family protein [endosymbiont of Lamellibrachia barhami]|uniref:carboxymuconolactone decarboxylase family protein n=1 Tax=endosymbiont of Lamellibrachia barhami TaxID=205975 RepID=UPI001FEAB2B1|nr:carboxymuconolactone decarboxylase family protein [endosymbiont of Lamellibrachia barhami]
MSSFPVHSRESAPEAAHPTLDTVAGLFGFIPNLLGVMATSRLQRPMSPFPVSSKSGLNAAERQVVLLTVSRFHECHYCMAAHSLAADMEQVPADVVEAIRSDHPITDPKLEALRVYVYRLIEKRGWIDETEMAEFLAAGFEPSHALDVLVGVGQKTLSNFTNHLAKTPLDSAFEQHAWAPAE